MTTIQIEDLLRLSPLQHALLSREIAFGAGSDALVQKVYRIQGCLDSSLLQKAWKIVVANTPLLRARIEWEGIENPVIVVQTTFTVPWLEDDRSTTDESGLEAELRSVCAEQRSKDFNLQSGPLMDVIVVRLRQNESAIVFTAHEMILDAWSLDLLLKRLCGVYEALSKGRSPKIEPDSGFKQYTSWVYSQDLAGAASFWRTAGSDDLLDGSQESPNGRRYEAAFIQEQISDESLRRFLTRRTDSELYPLLCGVWARVLECCLGDQQDAVDAYVAGRAFACQDAEKICGSIGRFLPFSIPSPQGLSVAEWQQRLDSTWKQMNRYAHSTPESVHRANSAVVVSGPPFRFSIQVPDGELLVEEKFATGAARHPLILRVRNDVPQTLEVQYDSRQFSKPVVRNLIKHFGSMLQEFNARPDQPLLSVGVLDAEERQQVLAWSCAAGQEPASQLVHSAIETRAVLDGGAVAAVWEGESITYQELNSRANQLATYLREAGVSSESIVATFMPRSLETLVAVLAIHKAGGAYLPVDTDLPKERTAFLLRDTNPCVLLTKQDFVLELPPEVAAINVFCVDSEWVRVAKHPETNQAVDLSPESLAYVIYTSGSTGQPKGVAVSHRAAAAHLGNMQNAFAYRPGDRVLQFASLSFDVSIEQMLAPLLSGATVVLKSNVPWTPSEFFAAVREQAVTVINVPPAFWAQLAEFVELAPKSLRLVIVGGDAMSAETVRRWRQGSKVPVVNAYGPTEAVITATTFAVEGDLGQEEAGSLIVPIGRPLAQRRAYVLDWWLELAPPGAWQELYLGGDLLARGYLNRPEMTAEAFVPDPYSEKPGARLYRTGDRVKWNEDRQLEFGGRIDSQVKLRGYRIELGEIEAALVACNGVSQAVVSIHAMDSGEKRLAAYIVPEHGFQVSTAELREVMKQKLPDYMVPSFFDVLEALPQTPSGKVDRKRLPKPAEMQAAAPASSESDIGPTEHTVMKIWSEVLAVNEIDIRDDFFDIGGDSLLATQVISRVQKAFGVEVPLRVLFDRPTIESLTDAIEQEKEKAGREIALARVSRDQELPLSPAQERLWFLSQSADQSTTYNMTGAIQLDGSLQIPALEHALTEIVRRHEALRTAFPLLGDHPVQQILRPYPIKLPLSDLSSLPHELQDLKFKELLHAEAGLPFNLVEGPMFRCGLLRMSQDSHILLASIHHIAGDAWSLHVLVRELTALYAAFVNDESLVLPELPFQYADYAHWQKRLLERDAEFHLEYWRRRLSGYPPPAALPQQRDAFGEGGTRGATVSFRLAQDVSSRLKTLAHDAGATLFMTFLAAWKLLISRYCASSDIIVGTDIANRNQADTESMIGFFVNILAMRTDLSGNPTFLELLDRVREVALGAFEHQDLPFNRVIEDLNPSRAEGATSLFKTFFYMPAEGLQLLQLSGLKIGILEAEDHTAKFDLSLCARDTSAGISCSLNYKTDLFEEEAVAQIAGAYEMLLTCIAGKPSARINTLWSMVQRGAPSGLEPQKQAATGAA